MADLGIFQQTLQLSHNLPLNISPKDDKDKENKQVYLSIWHQVSMYLPDFSSPQVRLQVVLFSSTVPATHAPEDHSEWTQVEHQAKSQKVVKKSQVPYPTQKVGWKIW